MTLIGFDFSINKPAACIYSNNRYKFISWPYDLKAEIIETYKSAGIEIISREDNKNKGNGLSDQMRYEVQNSSYLANLITTSLMSWIKGDTYIAFEGLSYGSKGDSGIQLGGYKYMLMDRLLQLVPLDHMYTYSPITVKSIAGCAKKGMNKVDMINKFIDEGPVCGLRTRLFEYPEKFQTPKSKNWIIHLDDLIDSYWVLETLRRKEKIMNLV